MPEVSKIRSLHISAISPEKRGMKLIFCLQIKMQVFYRVLVSLWLSKAKHALSTQDNKFAIFLQYLKEREG